MASEVFVDEEVNLLYRVMPDGQIRPTSFVWRNRTRYVADLGRMWEERVQGGTLRCYMIQVADGDTFEVRFDPVADRWTVHRAWLRDVVV